MFSKETQVTKTEVKAEPISDLPPHKVADSSLIIDTPAGEDAIAKFLDQSPLATYLIDSSTDDSSLLCRSKPQGGQTCLRLGLHYTELFKTMQKFNYFCALPVHKVDLNYFECSKIE